MVMHASPHTQLITLPSKHKATALSFCDIIVRHRKLHNYFKLNQCSIKIGILSGQDLVNGKGAALVHFNSKVLLHMQSCLLPMLHLVSHTLARMPHILICTTKSNFLHKCKV